MAISGGGRRCIAAHLGVDLDGTTLNRSSLKTALRWGEAEMVAGGAAIGTCIFSKVFKTFTNRI